VSQFKAINDNQAPPYRERRVTQRRRVFYGGKIVGLHDALSADCTIRDLSPQGARIVATLPKGAGLGSALIVVRNGTLHEYRMAWRHDAQIGLSFESSVDLSRSESLPVNLLPLRKVWLELMPR
jgi:hypothetical protein